MNDAPTTPDPIEIAMEAEASGVAPEGIAHEVLRKQSALIGWQIASERAGFALKVLTALAGLAVAAVIAGMMWRASQADGLVVEPFSVPPELAQRGVTGAAVAGELLDQLSRLNRETNTLDNLRVTDSWSAESHVEIPQTGVSLDEVNRLLRRWLGHQTYVSGAVMLTEKGLMLTARTGQGGLARAEGPANDLPGLAGALAEPLLAQARPLQYGRLLVLRGQFEPALAVYKAAVVNARTDAERAAAHRALGALYWLQSRNLEARSEFREAVHLGSEASVMNLSMSERALGHLSDAAELCYKAAKIERRRGSYGQATGRQGSAFVDNQCALNIGDYLAAERMIQPVIDHEVMAGYRGFSGGEHENRIRALTGLHDIGAARREFPVMMASSATQMRKEGFRVSLMVRIAAEEEDWPLLLSTLASATAPANAGQLESPTSDAWRALALAHLGRMAEARAMAATLPGDCYRCVRVRAQIAELAGDRAGADRAFAEAVRQAPKLAFADLEWGAALLARGQPDAAIAHLTTAARLSPNFADPLELWGEALLAQDDTKAAAAKFAEAAKLAPRWGRLHLKWGEALAKLGRADEARAKWRAAAGMDLSAADRAALAGLKAGRL